METRRTMLLFFLEGGGSVPKKQKGTTDPNPRPRWRLLPVQSGSSIFLAAESYGSLFGPVGSKGEDFRFREGSKRVQVPGLLFGIPGLIRMADFSLAYNSGCPQLFARVGLDLDPLLEAWDRPLAWVPPG